MTTRRRDVAARSAGFVLAVTVLVGAPLAAGSASATQGSVPAVVATYAADPAGLLARLDDLFGIGSGGNGLDFGDDTKVGELDRVFVWTDGFLSGGNGTAMKRVNEWTATITIADKPVGVATLWINPEGDIPDLADFTRGASLGAAFTALDAEAALVHDTAHSAWFTVTDDKLVPLVEGDSGVKSATTVTSYQKRLIAAAKNLPIAQAPANQGAINSVVVIAIVVLAIIALVVLTGRRSKRAADAAAVAAALTPSAKPQATAPGDKQKSSTPGPPARKRPAEVTATTPAQPPKGPGRKVPRPATSSPESPVLGSASAPSKTVGTDPAAKAAQPVARTAKPVAQAPKPTANTAKPAATNAKPAAKRTPTGRPANATAKSTAAQGKLATQSAKPSVTPAKSTKPPTAAG